MIDPIFHLNPTKSASSFAACQFIFSRYDQKKVENREFDMFMSGGNTPVECYAFLVKNLGRRDIHFFQVDERWVESTSPRSNQKMIKEILGSTTTITEMMTPELGYEIEQASNHYNEILLKFQKDRNYLFGIFGMGEDGHTASLFPQIYDINETSLATWYFVPQQDEFRLTITPSFISKFDAKLLLINGKGKGTALASALNENDFNQFPVLNLFKSECHVFLDQDAFSAFKTHFKRIIKLSDSNN